MRPDILAAVAILEDGTPVELLQKQERTTNEPSECLLLWEKVPVGPYVLTLRLDYTEDGLDSQVIPPRCRHMASRKEEVYD